MSTLSSLLNLSLTALNADQAALTVTANNVANQNTPGYTDQVAHWSSGDTVSFSLGGAQTTVGPNVSSVSQRDRVLNQRIQQQTQAQSETGSEANILSQLEGVLSITGSSSTAGSTQIGTSINSFFASLTALANNPSDAATRQGVLNAAGAVATAFNAAANGISNIQTSINGTLTSSVAQVNNLTKTVAALNAQIAASSPSIDAGTLEDQRQQAITQLSALVGLDQVTTQSNGIELSTTDGTVLVSGTRAYALSSSQVGSTTQIYGGATGSTSIAVAGGTIGGLLAAQGVDLPAAQSALDALAYRLGSAVNIQNAAGVTSGTTAGGMIFNVPPSPVGAASALRVVASSPNVLAAAATGQGSTGNLNANALASLASFMDGSGQTINGNLAALLANVGSTSSGLQGKGAAQQASLTQLITQQSTQSGVNLDTEASNLTQYQRSYQAAAQVLSIVNKLMTAAINLGLATAAS